MSGWPDRASGDAVMFTVGPLDVVASPTAPPPVAAGPLESPAHPIETLAQLVGPLLVIVHGHNSGHTPPNPMRNVNR